MGVLVKALEWRKAHYPKTFELALSVVFGILIEIVILHFQPPLLMVRKVGDDTADQMVRLLEQTTYSMPMSPTFVFVDIDDATWKTWGSHLVTPRARIATLLGRVARSKPLAVVLDVDLAYWTQPMGKRSKISSKTINPGGLRFCSSARLPTILTAVCRNRESRNTMKRSDRERSTAS